MIIESIRMAWRNIKANKLRSFLTVLGVLIGVASIIALISIVQGVTQSITSQVIDMGANKVTIQVIGTPLKSGLTLSELDNLSHIDNIDDVSPTLTGIRSIAQGNTVMEEVSIIGKSDSYFINPDDTLQLGRGINQLDVATKNRVCLIGTTVAETLFPTGNALESKLTIDGIEYLVIGILKDQSDFTASNMNQAVIVPYTTAMNTLATGNINSLEITLKDEKLSQDTTLEIKGFLNNAFNANEDSYKVSNMQSILDTVKEMTTTMTMMLAGIAGISLLVGGIGIMNMMLVSVSERTSEIGLRKALGAKPQTIQLQFLLESIFLSLFGGGLGLLLGLFIAWIASILIAIDFVVAGYSVVLALGFSALIGIVFGYTPAKVASQLNPIEALRSS